MKSSFALLAAGLAAPVISAAVAATEYTYLPFVSLQARQNVSPEKYKCHENCGNAITQGASGTAHCSDKTWNDRFDYCMECANEFNIWGDYGRGVTHAADACNLEINLKSNGTETASTDSASETTTAAASTPTDNAGSVMTSSASMMLFAMIAAAGLL